MLEQKKRGYVVLMLKNTSSVARKMSPSASKNSYGRHSQATTKIFTFLESLAHPLSFNIQYKFLYLWLNQNYSPDCEDGLEHNFAKTWKSGQMHFSIEAKIGNFFSGNGTNLWLYAVRGTFSVPRRKYLVVVNSRAGNLNGSTNWTRSSRCDDGTF